MNVRTSNENWKNLGKKFPNVKNLASKSARCMARIIKESKGNDFVFHVLLKQKLQHYCGNYKCCSLPS
jgi:hypothetical protein